LSTSTNLNDVNLEAVAGLAGKVQESPEVADTVWQATVTWNGSTATSGPRGADCCSRHKPNIAATAATAAIAHASTPRRGGGSG